MSRSVRQDRSVADRPDGSSGLRRHLHLARSLTHSIPARSNERSRHQRGQASSASCTARSATQRSSIRRARRTKGWSKEVRRPPCAPTSDLLSVLRLPRIDQRPVLKVLGWELLCAGRALEFLQGRHSCRSEKTIARERVRSAHACRDRKQGATRSGSGEQFASSILTAGSIKPHAVHD